MQKEVVASRAEKAKRAEKKSALSLSLSLSFSLSLSIGAGQQSLIPSLETDLD
jgi:hypothetical protein